VPVLWPARPFRRERRVEVGPVRPHDCLGELVHLDLREDGRVAESRKDGAAEQRLDVDVSYLSVGEDDTHDIRVEGNRGLDGRGDHGRGSIGRTGSMRQQRFQSFERFRRGLRDPEIVTFDELYERARLVLDLADEAGADAT